MTFTNLKYVQKTIITRWALTIALGSIFIIVGVEPWMDEYSPLGIRWLYGIIAACLYLAYYLWRFYQKYNFIYFSDEGQSILLRYYQIRMFGRKPKAIAVPKESYGGYEIQGNKLILKQSRGGSVAAYPAVSLNGLSKEEIGEITGVLSYYKIR